MTPVFGLCEDYVTRWAALDPVSAGMHGITATFGAGTDYSPDGAAARADLITGTLTALDPMTITSDTDRLAARFLRERLEAQLAWHQTKEPLRQLSAPIGLISSIRDSVELLPRDGEDAWRNIAARLAAIAAMFTSWRASLDAGLAEGVPAARRQAVEAAVAADRCAGAHDALVASYGEGPLASELAAAAARAHQGYAEIARYLREDYAPRASDVDGVGSERYAVAARLSLGADIDLKEAYEWGWAELRRIEAEMRAEANTVSPGASVPEASAVLNESAYVIGEDAYLAWLQDRHDRAVERLDGRSRLLHPAERGPDQARAHLVAAGRPGPRRPVPDLVRALYRLPRRRARSSPAGRRGQDRRGFPVTVRQDQLRQRSRRGLGPVRRAARRRARLVHRARDPPGHAGEFGVACRAGGPRHRCPPGPAAARRHPVDVR